MDHLWRPGENRATCLAHNPECEPAPGRRCRCGLWAVWSPLRCLSMARHLVEPPWVVVGLVAGWGTVALHGGEGFRSEHAAVRCLFTDWAREAPVPRPSAGRLAGWWRRIAGAAPAPRPAAEAKPDPERLMLLRRAAAGYGVPLLSLREALELRVLGEWAVAPEHIREVATWVAATAGHGTRIDR